MLQVGDIGAVLRLDRLQYNSGLKGAESDFDSFGSRLKSKAESIGSAIGNALKVGIVAGGAAAVAGATAGLNAFKDLETASSDAAAKAVDVNSKSAQQIKEQYDSLKNHVMSVSRELGAQTVFDPTQVAGAFQEIAGAGYDVAKVGNEQLRPFLDLAASDMQYGLIPATKLAMSTISQFGLTMEDSGRVSDVLAKGAAGSAAGLEDFAYAFKYVGPVAKATGMSLEETTAIIGKLADKGYKGEMAGAALRSSMLQLSTVTKPMGDALERLGIKYDQVDPRTHSFLDTLDLLKSKGANVYDLEQIFGKESAPIIEALSGMTSGVRGFTFELEHSTGVARIMAALKLDSLGGDLEAAKGAAMDLAIGLGQYLAPSARAVLQWFSAIQPKIAEFGDAIAKGDWGKVGDMLAEGIQGGWNKLQDLGKQLYDKIKGASWKGLGDYIQKAVEGGWKELYSLGTQLLAKLKGVRWGELGQTVGSTIANALIGLGQWVYNAFSNVKWDQAAQTIIGGLKGAFDYYSNYYATLGTTLYDAISKVDWGTIGQRVLASLKAISGEISKIFDGISFSDLGQKVIDGIKGALSLLEQVGKAVWSTLNNLPWKEIGETAGKAIFGAIDTGVNVLNDIGKKIADFIDSGKFEATAKSIAGKIQSGLESLKKWGSELAAGIESSGKWGDLGDKIGVSIKAGLSKINDYYTAIYDSIKNWANTDAPKDLGRLIGSAIGDALVSVLKIAEWIYNNLDESASDKKWVDVGLKIGGKFLQGFAEGLAPLDKEIGKIVNEAFASAFESIANMIPDVPGLRDLKANLLYSAQLSRTAIQTVYASPAQASPAQTSTPSAPSAPTPPVVQSPAGAPAGAGSYNGQTVGDYMWTGDHWIYSPSLSPSIGSSAPAASTPSAQSNLASIVNPVGRTIEQFIAEISKSGKFSSTDEVYNALRDYYREGGNTGTVEDYFGDSGIAKKIIQDNFVAPIEDAGKNLKENTKSSVDLLVDGIFETEESLKNAISGLTSAVKQNTLSQIAASSTAANALKLGGEISGKFLSNAGNAVAIGLNAQGQQVAIIGEVAKQKWLAAGNQIIGDSVSGGQQIKQLSGQAGQTIQLSHIVAGDTTKSAANTAAGSTTGAATASAGKTVAAAQTHLNSVNQGASIALAAIAQAGDPGTKLALGAQYAANALVQAGQTLLSMASRNSYSYTTGNPVLDNWKKYFGFASGTRTSGPQMAMIGEDGPTYPEFVIPTKTKRWDLLYQALRAYGIGGFAEGTATGSTGSTDGSNVIVSFGIPGITAAAKSIKRTLGDLQSYFRITWNIIKSDALQYWMAISSWLTGKLSELSTSVSVSAMGWRASLKSQMAAISAEQLQSWSQVASQAKVNFDSITSSIVQSHGQMKQDLSQGLNDISNALTSFSANWQNIWTSSNTYFGGAAQEIRSKIQDIINDMSALGSMQVSPSVNVNYTGGGGGDYGGWSPEGGGSGDWLNEGGVCAPSNSPLPANVGSSIAGTAVPTFAYSGKWAGPAGNYYPTVSSFFAAKGADLTTPQMIVAAEKGPELVLPTDIRNTIVSLTEMGFDKIRGGGGDQVQEIHIHQHLNGREISHEVFKVGVKAMRAKGLSLA